MAEKPQLIFVYNADTGFFNLVSDMGHKLLSPDTYQCNLCMITHSHFGMRETWKKFFETLDAELTFLHRNEFQEQYGVQDAALPAVFIKDDQGVSEWLSADVINRCENTEDLQQAITDRLANAPA